jgi:hypothetical protein
MKTLMNEWRDYVSEFMYHDPSTGHFTKRAPGAVKSLTRKGARSKGVDSKYVERGVVTANDKVSAKMGSNFGKEQCGRKNMDGDEIAPKHKCSDYKEKYVEQFDVEAIEEMLVDEEQESVCDQCIQSFLARIRRANAALKSARDGKERK